MGWVFNNRFAALLFIFILFCCRIVDADEAADNEEAASLVSAYLANFEAVEAFDVFWSCESQFVGDNGHVQEVVSSGRLMVDPENNRCCCVLDYSLTKLVATKEGAKEKRSVALSGLVFDGKQAWSRGVPQPTSRIRGAKIEDVLKYENTVFLPAIGVGAFPSYYSQARDFRDFIDATRYQNGLVKLVGKAGNLQTVSFDSPPLGALTIERFTQMDCSSYIPVKYRETAVYSDGRVFPKVRESYRFTDQDGLQLPVGITGERREVKTVDEKRVKGTETYDVQIRWLSINEPMSEDYFRVDVLNDIQKITELVDLKLLNEEPETK